MFQDSSILSQEMRVHIWCSINLEILAAAMLFTLKSKIITFNTSLDFSFTEWCWCRLCILQKPSFCIKPFSVSTMYCSSSIGVAPNAPAGERILVHQALQPGFALCTLVKSHFALVVVGALVQNHLVQHVALCSWCRCSPLLIATALPSAPPYSPVWGGTFKDFTQICNCTKQCVGADLSKIRKCSPSNIWSWSKCASSEHQMCGG